MTNIKSERRNTNKNINTFTEKNFEGQTPDIGGVLALQGETHIRKRVTYDRLESVCDITMGNKAY